MLEFIDRPLIGVRPSLHFIIIERRALVAEWPLGVIVIALENAVLIQTM